MSNNRPESHSARTSFSRTVANQKSSARLIFVKLANNRVIGAGMGDESVKEIRNREPRSFPANLALLKQILLVWPEKRTVIGTQGHPGGGIAVHSKRISKECHE